MLFRVLKSGSSYVRRIRHRMSKLEGRHTIPARCRKSGVASSSCGWKF